MGPAPPGLGSDLGPIRHRATPSSFERQFSRARVGGFVRNRRLAWWPLLLVLASCSKHATAPAPFVGNEPGPDLRAVEVFLFQPSWPIGSRAPASPEPRRAMPLAASAIPAQLGDVYVGVQVAPAVRQACVGSFHGYKIRFYANDVLWWERDTD